MRAPQREDDKREVVAIIGPPIIGTRRCDVAMNAPVQRMPLYRRYCLTWDLYRARGTAAPDRPSASLLQQGLQFPRQLRPLARLLRIQSMRCISL